MHQNGASGKQRVFQIGLMVHAHLQKRACWLLQLLQAKKTRRWPGFFISVSADYTL